MHRPLAVLFLQVCFGIFATSILAQPQVESATVAVETQRAQPEYVRVEETTAEFARVVSQVNQFSMKHGVENVLLVVDLDNTLLAMNQDLGSDQWFTWQESLQKSDEEHPHLVAKKFDGLLEAQGMLFALSAMHPPQPDLPALLAELLERKTTAVILTSRGKEFRNAAARELKRNKYHISSSTLQIDEKRGVFMPYSSQYPDKHGLSAEIIKELGDPRSVTFSEGVYMTAGQHKGYMLKTLLARIPQSSASQPFANFKAIVFVDDHPKHTKRMLEAFEEEPVDLATFRYSREDGNVERFKNSTKSHVIRDWNLLNGFTKSVLVK